MRRTALISLAVGTLVAFATGARAANAGVNLASMTVGYTYFNRSGADLREHNEAVIGCLAEAGKTRASDEQDPAQLGGVVGSIVNSAIQSAYHHGAVGASLENCMVVRGWRVVLLPTVEGAALASSPIEALNAQLAPWVGAQSPHGQIVRIWANDAVRATTVRFSYRPAHLNNGQLSLIAATGHLTQFVPSAPIVSNTDALASVTALDKRWTGLPLKPSALKLAPPDGGVIIVRLKGLSMGNGTYLGFGRIGATKDAWPSLTDHRLGGAVAGGQAFFQSRNGAIIAIAVPAGRWRIALMGSVTEPILNFCLGAPSFEVRAGETVYVGSFDFGGDLGPDLDLGPVRAWLAGEAQASTVRAAVFTNGSQSACSGNAIYALEYNGAPFEPGYTWGGAAR